MKARRCLAFLMGLVFSLLICKAALAQSQNKEKEQSSKAASQKAKQASQPSRQVCPPAQAPQLGPQLRSPSQPARTQSHTPSSQQVSSRSSGSLAQPYQPVAPPGSQVIGTHPSAQPNQQSHIELSGSKPLTPQKTGYQQPSTGPSAAKSSPISIKGSDVKVTKHVESTKEEWNNCVLFARSKVNLPKDRLLNSMEQKRAIINSQQPAVGDVAIISVPQVDKNHKVIGPDNGVGHVAVVKEYQNKTKNNPPGKVTITIEEANFNNYHQYKGKESTAGLQTRTVEGPSLEAVQKKLGIEGYYDPRVPVKR